MLTFFRATIWNSCDQIYLVCIVIKAFPFFQIREEESVCSMFYYWNRRGSLELIFTFVWVVCSIKVYYWSPFTRNHDSILHSRVRDDYNEAPIIHWSFSMDFLYNSVSDIRSCSNACPAMEVAYVILYGTILRTCASHVVRYNFCIHCNHHRSVSYFLW